MPSKQSIATRKYEEKTGWIAKTYKLKKKDVDDFREACDHLGVSQAHQLTKMMRDFVEANREEK